MLEMIRRIFKIAGRSRQKIIVGITFNILKSFFNGFMMFGVFCILLHLENLTPTIILQAFGVVLGSVIGRFFFQWMYDRTMSGTGYDIFRDYRLEIGEKLKQAPMGYFSEQNLGTIQTILTTTIADLEGYSMLAIEQMTSGVAMAALMSIMMFFFNPIIAILSLIGLLLGLLVLRWVRSRAAQYAPIYQEAQENSAAPQSAEYILDKTIGSDEAAENKKLTFDNISCKEKMIRATLNWAISSDSIVSGTYLDVLRSEYQKCLDMDGFLNTLDHIDQWLKYRNEVIHGLFNKNAACLNESIREEVEAGMRYARFIDSQVKALKKKDAIRTKMRIRP